MKLLVSNARSLTAPSGAESTDGARAGLVGASIAAKHAAYIKYLSKFMRNSQHIIHRLEGGSAMAEHKVRDAMQAAERQSQMQVARTRAPSRIWAGSVPP